MNIGGLYFGSEYDPITLGNGAGDAVSVAGAFGDTITLGNGAGDTVSAVNNESDSSGSGDTITLGNGAGDAVNLEIHRRHHNHPRQRGRRHGGYKQRL